MGNFQELKVWQRAKDLAVFIYIIAGISYIVKEDFDHIENECKAISGMLTRLIKAHSKK